MDAPDQAPGPRLVGSAMSVPAVAVRASCHLSVAVDVFVRTGLRHLVVVDDDARPLGVIAYEHVSAAWLEPGARRAGRVEQVLTRPQPAVTPETTVQAAARLMVDAHVDVLPVVSRGGLLQGVLTAYDVLSVVATDS